MKKILFSSVLIGGFLVGNVYAKKIEQTICFSSSKCTGIGYGVLGDNVKLCGGKCHGRTLSEMNKAGWKLTQVVSGLSQSFGMVFTKER